MSTKKIMVVDDEAGILRVLDRTLRKAGYSVRGIISPREVVPLLQKEEFDLVLLDMVMPGVDGLELLRAVRQAAPRIPVILMTGYASPDMIASTMGAGAQSFMAEPFAPEELISELSRVFSESQCEDIAQQTGGSDDAGL